MTAIILWLSRHKPSPRQIAELERLYPGHTLTIDSRAFDGADDIVARYHKSGATDLVVVAPLSFVRELVRRGLHPLWAEMRQIARGSPEADSHHNGRSYRFIRFNRIRSVTVELDPAVALPQPSTSTKIASTSAPRDLGDSGCKPAPQAETQSKVKEAELTCILGDKSS